MTNGGVGGEQSKLWDVFISHASEDKDAFVRPLAVALRSLGVSVWYDEFSLRLGDSLSRSIDRGLADSSFGLVVVSHHFIVKPWPEYELRGLVAREIEEDRVILPIWLGVSRHDVLAFSPPLADKVAVVTGDQSAIDIAIQILREVRPDIYRASPRARLERLANGDALAELQSELQRAQDELEETREELAEYRCPHCGSALVARMEVEVGDRGDSDSREEFDCGFVTLGGFIERPCPRDPRFPAFEEYELHTSLTNEGPDQTWFCFAIGKTLMAQRLHLSPQHGDSREEAELRIKNQYLRIRGEP